MKKTAGFVLALGLVLTVMAAACDDDGPTGIGDVEGTYTGTHRFTFGGVIADITCTGSVVIINVSGTAMTGTLTINPCPDLDTPGGTTPISGTLSSSGSLSFTVPGQDEFIEEVNEAGCDVTRIDPGFEGSVVSDRIDASFTATVVCPPSPAEIPFVWRVDMTKST